MHIRFSSTMLAASIGVVAVTGFADGDRVFAQQPGKTMPQAAGEAPSLGSVVQPIADWLDRANREYQDVVVKQLSVPTGKGA